MSKKYAGVVLLVGLASSLLWSGEDGGRAGFDFLRTAMGARSAAMGGAFIAVAGDLHGLVYNPASLVGTRDRESTFTYLDHLLDIKSGFLGFSKSIPGAGRVGVGISYVNYGEMRRTDPNGEDLGSFMPTDFVFSVAHADSFSVGLRYGVTLKYIQSAIDEYTARGVAVDLGLIYRIPSQDLNVGFSVSNLGAAIQSFVEESEKLPLSYRLGISKRLAHLPLLLNLDLIKYQYGKSDFFWGLYWALGGEFTITDFFFLRWGYHSRGREEKVGLSSDRLAGASGGFGIRWRTYRLDYGLCSHGALGTMNYFTLTILF